jgi:hypothetical protein
MGLGFSLFEGYHEISTCLSVQNLIHSRQFALLIFAAFEFGQLGCAADVNMVI